MLTNHQIGSTLLKISRILSSFAAQLMDKPKASPSNVVHLPAKAGKPQVAAAAAKAAVKRSASPKLSKRHATIVAKFKQRGIKDPKLFTDIKTFDLWSKDGFAPRKGAKGVHGLFHRSQVQPIG